IKVNALPSLPPCARRTTEEESRRFLRMHQDLAHRIERSRGIDAARIRIQSPIASWIHYPLGFSCDFVLAHERRPLWQAWQVRRQLPSVCLEAGRPVAIPK